MENQNHNKDIKWAIHSMIFFILLALIFNSQSMLNYSKLWDVSAQSLQIKNIVKNWHEKMEILGANAPRKLIEIKSRQFKNLKFSKPNGKAQKQN